MSAMTHARNQAITANYYDMDGERQQEFDQFMERADIAATNGEYLALMVCAAFRAGIDLPYGSHIRKCACSCCCPAIFDPHHPDAHEIEASNGYNLGRYQCDTCADRHRETA